MNPKESVFWTNSPYGSYANQSLRTLPKPQIRSKPTESWTFLLSKKKKLSQQKREHGSFAEFLKTPGELCVQELESDP